jgi:hypothetical protein
MSEKFIIDATGWLAMVLILWAYFLISRGKVDAKNLLYQLLNFIGAILFVINLSYMKAWPSVALNIIWALIALIALRSILRGKKNNTSGNEPD